ncbi:hypothetical protein HanRHA438_Chr10g0462471 [Helianthus annuus]|nr:hypothetical protein HanRHA438_Chr10g0462471 [Helianthus annuus]
MFCLKLFACYLICLYLFSFHLSNIYVSYVLTLDMLYLFYYMLILVPLFDSLCVFLAYISMCWYLFCCPILYVSLLMCILMCLYLFAYSFNILLFSKAFYSIFLKLENTRIVQTRRVYQNRRETHNLVNDFHSV